jgi:hypothetical protein
MTSLLSVYDSHCCIGCCDKRCYDAKTIRCNCICRGTNHGVGLEQAVRNIAERDVGLRCDDVTNYSLFRRLDADRKLVVINRLKVRDVRAAQKRARRLLCGPPPVPMQPLWKETI